MTLTLAAVGAVVAAVLELTLWPYIAIGDAHPHLVLVYVVILAVALGLDASIAAAFVGGLTIDFLAPRPLGSTAFALLLCAGLAVVLSRLLVQIRYFAPIVIVFVLACGAAMATIAWAKAFKDLYKPKPGSAIVKAKCAVCHIKPIGTKNDLNPYGKLLAKKPVGPASLKAIEKLDADKDGFSNIAEIKAGTLPGDPKSKPKK